MSTPFMVYVVCTRPYAEKVVGGGIGSRGQVPCDGTFYLDYESARDAANWLNARDSAAGTTWWHYPALLTVNPACSACGGSMAHHDDPDEHSVCKEFKF